MAASRILPLNWATGADGQPVDEAVAYPPKAAMQSITMAIRAGKDKRFALGYIKSFNWSMNRASTTLHQIEPYPDGTFSNANSFDTASFSTSFYWPGEPVEVIPGKVDAIDITLDKYAMYTNNLLRSLLSIEGAGTEHVTGVTNNADIHYAGTGQNEYVSLIQQVRPVYIYQIFINPITGNSAFGRVFEECWFESIGEDIPDASQNGPITENGKLKATRMRPFVIPTEG